VATNNLKIINIKIKYFSLPLNNLVLRGKVYHPHGSFKSINNTSLIFIYFQIFKHKKYIFIRIYILPLNLIN